MFNKSSKPQNRIDSLIGAGTTIEGDVAFTGGLRIDGNVKGNVRATGNKPGTLVISELAKVEGNIDVAHVVVNGTVAGPVRATEYVELLPKARVTGNVGRLVAQPAGVGSADYGHYQRRTFDVLDQRRSGGPVRSIFAAGLARGARRNGNLAADGRDSDE